MKGEKRKENEERKENEGKKERGGKTVRGGKEKIKGKGFIFPVFRRSKVVSPRIKVGLLNESYE